jgi:hypothetical protein
VRTAKGKNRLDLKKMHDIQPLITFRKIVIENIKKHPVKTWQLGMSLGFFPPFSQLF